MTNEDAVKREAVLNTLDAMDAALDENRTVEAYKELLKECFKELPPVTPKQRWIPVSKRLPKKTGLYLVSVGDLVTTGSFDGHNFRTQTMVRFVPDAWMPLPEPYKDESDTKSRKEWPYKPCINYEDGCEEWAGCPCVHYKAESGET